ncbi:Pirin [Methanosarcina sp. MTP4]|nr:pirin family protein [Methanosarcina sp. MTP4]AKB25147.1 Pirin [Methanosarcina sp. MTP4]
MGKVRKIKKIMKSMPTIEGAGVHLKRAFGFHQVPELDPFLLLDDFHSEYPEEYIMGFPWHPHRGIETITYVLHGEVDHGDSMGNSGVIEAGDVQWMTAGSGIVHQEMPKGEKSGLMWGFQLWANLPASHKMMDPRYQEIKSSQIPELFLEKGIKMRIICGAINGVEGPVKGIVTDPVYVDVTVPRYATFTHMAIPGYTMFAYVIDGAGYFDEERDPYAFELEGAKYFDLRQDCLIDQENLVLYGDGDSIEVTAGEKGVRFLLVSGKPIREPVAWYGPIVMNTQEELKVAFEEYRSGRFIKHLK